MIGRLADNKAVRQKIKELSKRKVEDVKNLLDIQNLAKKLGKSKFDSLLTEETSQLLIIMAFITPRPYLVSSTEDFENFFKQHTVFRGVPISPEIILCEVIPLTIYEADDLKSLV